MTDMKRVNKEDVVVDVLEFKLPHTSKEIYGLTFSDLTSCFWWFQSNRILYHYRTSGKTSGPTLTHYFNLPDGVTKETHDIYGYDIKNSVLYLSPIN